MKFFSRKRKRGYVYETKWEPLFQAVLTVIFIFISFIFLYPYWHVLVDSFSPPAYAQMAGFKLWPKVFSIESYIHMLNTTYLWRGYINTIQVCILNWIFSMSFTILGAYPLSKKDLPFRGYITAMIIFTMFVGGGLIPSYLLINNTLGLRNNIMALVIPGCVSTFNLVIMRNYFMSLPIELEEAATIDGANAFQVLSRVILPLSAPMLATISLWILVGNWNAYFGCMLYITDSSKFVLQLVLRRIIQSDSREMTILNEGVSALLDTDVSTLRASAIILATLPIICVYPFIQKYFVKGVMIGSLKG